MHLAIAAVIHDARGDRGTADRYLDLVRWLEKAEEQFDPELTLWQSRLLARRGRHEDARALLERPDVNLRPSGDVGSKSLKRGKGDLALAYIRILDDEPHGHSAASCLGA